MSLVAALAAANEAVTAQPTQWPYVIVAWLVTVVTLVAYALVTVRRGRRLSRDVPPESRRWM